MATVTSCRRVVATDPELHQVPGVDLVLSQTRHCVLSARHLPRKRSKPALRCPKNCLDVPSHAAIAPHGPIRDSAVAQTWLDAPTGDSFGLNATDRCDRAPTAAPRVQPA